MSVNPLAGKPAPTDLLIDLDRLRREYHERQSDVSDVNQLVSFGTSGHRGTPLDGTFTQSHILAITQAICEYRQSRSYTGPLFLGMDTHAVSRYAQETAVEVLAANGADVYFTTEFTPTPVISHAILTYNRGRKSGWADGVVITPSHNPPADGGFKYNPPNGGPADTDVTTWIQNRANELLKSQNRGVKRFAPEQVKNCSSIREYDFITPYVRELTHVIDFEAIRSAKVKIGVDPLGGSAIAYWQPIAELYGLDLTVVNPKVDGTFGFMTVDHDGKIRMDCSSPYAMASLVRLKGNFAVAFGNDPDADRHGIVTPSVGLLNPNHFLSVAIRYLLTHRPEWPTLAGVGKTLVSSSMIDRVVKGLGRKLVEVPVGFKWFAPGLFDGSICFGGEESAGASFLRRDGSVWTTDKDGPIMGLLAAEIVARTEKDPGQHYQELTTEYGSPHYLRIDAPATPEEKNKLKSLSPDQVTAQELAGEPITAKLSKAPGNDASIGGLKVTTANGWFAARPSGTENVYKLYAESFKDEQHLSAILEQAQAIVARALESKK